MGVFINMKKVLHKNLTRALRKKRARARIFGNKEIPRLSIFRSNKFIYAQLIDDETRRTLFSASTRGIKSKKTEAAKAVGSAVADAAKKMGIKQVVFHRGPYRFHGRVKAVADGVKEGGIRI